MATVVDDDDGDDDDDDDDDDDGGGGGDGDLSSSFPCTECSSNDSSCFNGYRVRKDTRLPSTAPLPIAASMHTCLIGARVLRMSSTREKMHSMMRMRTLIRMRMRIRMGMLMRMRMRMMVMMIMAMKTAMAVVITMTMPIFDATPCSTYVPHPPCANMDSTLGKIHCVNIIRSFQAAFHYIP